MTPAERLTQIVATYYGTDIEKMRAKRDPDAVWLRAVACKAVEHYPEVSWSSLGRVWGLDHSSVNYLRSLDAVRGRGVFVDVDLLRLLAIGMSARRRFRADPCPTCGGTGSVRVLDEGAA